MPLSCIVGVHVCAPILLGMGESLNVCKLFGHFSFQMPASEVLMQVYFCPTTELADCSTALVCLFVLAIFWPFHCCDLFYLLIPYLMPFFLYFFFKCMSFLSF